MQAIKKSLFLILSGYAGIIRLAGYAISSSAQANKLSIAEIAKVDAEARQDQAAKTLSQALQAAKTIKDADLRPWFE